MTLTISNPGKIGIGTWDFDSSGTALTHVEALDFGWYYNWRGEALWDAAGGAESRSSEFVPMIWGRAEIDPLLLEQITKSSATTLLGFNEPDHKPQANMSVEEALELWPDLMATGKRLGSPATTTDGALGEQSWLGRFMQGVQDNGYRVDFIAAHYYSDNKDVGAFKAYLESLHDAYGLPIWVTEWALVDWLNPDRFGPEEIAAFASEAIQMMDGLDFVERHAWFGAYEGGDGWHINTELFDSEGQLTAVGAVFAQALGGDALVVGEVDEDLTGAIGGDGLAGDVDEDLAGAIDGDALADAGEGNNVPKGAGNNRGGPGKKKKVAGEGDDVHKTSGGDNELSDGPGMDMLFSSPGADTFVYKDVAHMDVRDFTLGTDLFDLAMIDATTQLAGAAARAQAGRLRFEDGILSGDVKGNGQADFEVRSNSALWSSDDFLV